MASAAMLLLLRRRARQHPASGNPETVARGLEHGLIPVYFAGRQQARRFGLDRLTDEVELATGAARPLFGTQAAVADAVDLNHAIRAARGYHDGWLAKAETELAAGTVKPFDAATRAQQWRLRVAAKTENAHAFAAERNAALRNFATTKPTQATQLVKVWDSVLDPERTCYICSGAHGTWVPLDEDFPEGTPGGVHPNCQCTVQILTIDMVSPMLAAA